MVNFNPPPPPFYPRERTPVPIEWEVGWAPRPAWDVLEKRKILSIGIRTADHPGCSVVPLPTILPRLHVYCVMYIINKFVLFFVRGSATCIFRIIRVFQLSVHPTVTPGNPEYTVLRFSPVSIFSLSLHSPLKAAFNRTTNYDCRPNPIMDRTAIQRSVVSQSVGQSVTVS